MIQSIYSARSPRLGFKRLATTWSRSRTINTLPNLAIEFRCIKGNNRENYLFGKHFKSGKAFAPLTDISDHWPVTFDFEKE
jgi:hypothetical protein